MITNGNDPANPVLTQSPSLQNQTSLGLTKREQFAMAAMQGLLANPDFTGSFSYHSEMHYKTVSDVAVSHADALIAALNKGGDNA